MHSSLKLNRNAYRSYLLCKMKWQHLSLFQKHKCMESLREPEIWETLFRTEVAWKKIADTKLDCLFLLWIFGSKNVHHATVTRYTDEGSILTEVNEINVCCLWSSSWFLDSMPWWSSKYFSKSPFFRLQFVLPTGWQQCSSGCPSVWECPQAASWCWPSPQAAHA